MDTRGRLFAGLPIAAVLLSSCGSIGDPMYPSLNLPVRITDLRVVEHGNKLIINFTVPSLTTDGVAVKNLRGADLLVGDSKIPVDRTDPGPVHPVEVPVGPYVGKEIAVHVRMINSKGRASDWSNAVTLTVLPPLAPPSNISIAAAPEGGVKLIWTAPGETHFRIYRRSGTDATSTQVGESDKPEYVDKSAEYLKKYEYLVQGLNGTAESDMSAVAFITPQDTFPPAVPTGLTASPGVNSVELAWDRNTETDFKSYTVYRSVDNSPFEVAAKDIASPNYSDTHIEPGKHYRYTVSAIDQLNNPSAQSAPVEITP